MNGLLMCFIFIYLFFASQTSSESQSVLSLTHMVTSGTFWFSTDQMCTTGAKFGPLLSAVCQIKQLKSSEGPAETTHRCFCPPVPLSVLNHCSTVEYMLEKHGQITATVLNNSVSVYSKPWWFISIVEHKRRNSEDYFSLESSKKPYESFV